MQQEPLSVVVELSDVSEAAADGGDVAQLHVGVRARFSPQFGHVVRALFPQVELVDQEGSVHESNHYDNQDHG